MLYWKFTQELPDSCLTEDVCFLLVGSSWSPVTTGPRKPLEVEFNTYIWIKYRIYVFYKDSFSLLVYFIPVLLQTFTTSTLIPIHTQVIQKKPHLETHN